MIRLTYCSQKKYTETTTYVYLSSDDRLTKATNDARPPDSAIDPPSARHPAPTMLLVKFNVAPLRPDPSSFSFRDVKRDELSVSPSSSLLSAVIVSVLLGVVVGLCFVRTRGHTHVGRASLRTSDCTGNEFAFRHRGKRSFCVETPRRAHTSVGKDELRGIL